MVTLIVAFANNFDQMMFIPLVCILSLLVSTTKGSIIPCICNYHVQRSIYGTQSTAVFPVAFMYEFDCLPLVQNKSLGKDWIAVLYNNKQAFLKTDSLVKQQQCNGTKPFSSSFYLLCLHTTANQMSTSTKRTVTVQHHITKPSAQKTTSTPFASTQKSITSRRTTKRFTTPSITVTTLQPTITSQHLTASSANAGKSHICPQSLNRPGTTAIGQHGVKCYELRSGLKSWHDANQYCRHHGGYLVTVHSDVEQMFLRQFIKTHLPSWEHKIWIGLNDIEHEGHFVWTNGATHTYNNWKPGHDDSIIDSVVEDCVAMSVDTGLWDDQPCYKKPFHPFHLYIHPFVCQNGIFGVGSSFIVG